MAGRQQSWGLGLDLQLPNGPAGRSSGNRGVLSHSTGGRASWRQRSLCWEERMKQAISPRQGLPREALHAGPSARPLALWHVLARAPDSV